MNAETEICKKLVAAIAAKLDGVTVDGNWIAEQRLIKGTVPRVGPWMDVILSPRRYDGYTTRVAEFDVTLEGEFDVSSDTALTDTVNAYESLVALLTSWQHDIAAAKRDLTVPLSTSTSTSTSYLFDPVGVKMDGGALEIDRETLKRTYTQKLTIKGRISCS